MNVDTEAWVVTELEALGVPVGTQRPDPRAPRPAEWVRVIQVGTTGDTLVTENSLITVEAYAGTQVRARQLINDARTILRGQDGRLFGVSLYGGPTNLPDPDSEQARYTASFVVRARAGLTA